MSDVEHKVVELARESGTRGLEAALKAHEHDGWELAATLAPPEGTVSLVFKRPRPLFGA
jgi:hypothetical protein